MIQKESLSDDALLPFNSMNKYFVNSNNISAMALQKPTVNQNPIVQQPIPNGNPSFMGSKESLTEENIRYRNGLINQTQMNQAAAQHYNRMPIMMNAAPVNNDILTMHSLYMISNNYQPIDKLTLPVSHGNLSHPFYLPPDQMITEIEFNLAEDSLNQIILREDLDIVLLSRYTKDNAINFLKWPSSIKIYVNENPLTLDMSMYNQIPLHLPQYIKRHCLSGRNVVKFEMYDFSRFNNRMFQFHIYMVHRPTIAHSKKLALENALVCDENTIKLLQESCVMLNRDFMNVSTKCPITDKRIEIPIRFKDCSHLQPFDLVGFLKLQARWMLNICPLCRKNMYFNFNGCQQNIIIDTVLQSMFEKTPLICDMISVNSNASFTPLYPNNINPEYLQMIHQNNAMAAAGLQQRVNFHQVNEINNGVMSQQMRPMYRYVNVEQPINNSGQFLNVQSPPGPQFRQMIVNRSMLDFNPCDIYSSTASNNSQSPVKKTTTKRKAVTKKSKAAAALDAVANVRSNNCPTPPSVRTSSVASTSSPDSLNVPHSIPKRSPSIDHLPLNVIAESHLNDELLLYSSASSVFCTNETNTIFSDSIFKTNIDELVSSLPTATHSQSSSSSLSFNNPHHAPPPPPNFYRQFSQPLSQQQQQQQLPDWLNSNDSQIFSQHYQTPSTVVTPHNQYSTNNNNFNTFSNNNNNDIDRGPLSNRSVDTSQIQNSSSELTKLIDDILTNYPQVPELNECDWLDGFDGAANIIDTTAIIGLSDIEDF